MPTYTQVYDNQNETTQLAVSVNELYSDTPSPITDATIGAVLQDEYILPSLVNSAINGVHWRMESYFHYGFYEYSEQLPEQFGSLYREIDSYENADNVLSGIETLPYTIEDIRWEKVTSETAIEIYLIDEHGYSRFTQTVNSMPEDFRATFDVNKANFITASENDLISKRDALESGIPQNRTERSNVLYKDQNAVEVKTYEVTVNRSVSFIPTESISTVYTGRERDQSQPDIENYILNFKSTQTLKGRGLGRIQYQVKTTTHYELSDGTTTSPVTELLEPEVLSTGTVSYTELHSLTYTDERQPIVSLDGQTPEYAYLPRHLIIEYYVTEPSGNRIPKIYTRFFPIYLNAMYQGNMTLEDLAPNTLVFSDDYETKYFPIVPLIREGQLVFDESNKGTDLYETGTQLLLKLDLEASAINAAISEGNIEDVDEAIFILAADLNTGGQASLAYIFREFEEYYEKTDNLYRVVVDENNVFSIDVKRGASSINISEGNSGFMLAHAGIGVRFVKGRIGNVGVYEREYNIEDLDRQHVFLRKQISEDTYKEIVVVDPWHTTLINGYSFHTRIEDLANDEERNTFYIPIKKSTLSSFGSYTIQELYYQATKMIFLSQETEGKSFWESAGFKDLIIIGSIIVTLISGIDIYTTVSAALAAAGTTAALVALVTIAIKHYIIALALEYAVKVVGIEAAYIAALAAFAYGAYTGLSGNVGMLEPQQLMQLSASLNNAVSTNIQKDMLEFQTEVTAFQEEAESLMDELEAKQELLETSNIINPFYFVDNRPINDFTESPSTFYRRNLQTNIADLSYATIEKFVDVSLTLPKSNLNMG